MLVRLGIKVGMSRLFAADGTSVAVTVLDMSGNRVSQVKRADGPDGYDAIQLAHGMRNKKRINNAQIGHLAKHKAGLARRLMEVRCPAAAAAAAEPGTVLDLADFAVGTVIDVAGTSKGRGFAGVIKRHNFRSGRATHGNSRAHNKPGATGQCQDPGKVFKGKKMAGHMGAAKVTVRNLKVARIDAERQLLFVAGAVPGAANSEVVVRRAADRFQRGEAQD